MTTSCKLQDNCNHELVACHIAQYGYSICVRLYNIKLDECLDCATTSMKNYAGRKASPISSPSSPICTGL